MQPEKSSRSRNTMMLLTFIIATAAILSVTTYAYAIDISNSITDSSVQATNTDAQIEASEINHIFTGEMDAVASNVQILVSSDAVETHNVSAADLDFSAAQNATAAVTYSYFWGDANGSFVLARNGTASLTPVPGLNLTQRPYFEAAEENGTTYYSDVINSTKGVPTIYVVQPIYREGLVDGKETKVPGGVVGASVGVALLGEFLRSQLPTNLESGLGAISPDGVILYTQNQTLVGQSVYGPQFQALIPEVLRGQFDGFLNASLAGGSGVENLSYDGVSSTLAYQAVLTGAPGGNPTKPFAVLYIATADQLAASQAAQISLLRELSIAAIVGISASAVVASLVVVRWNRTLEGLVKRRTADLVVANQEMAAQSQAQRDVINIAAHELRTPTQAILTNAELLKDEYENPIPQVLLSGPSVAGSLSPSAAVSQAHDRQVQDLVNSTFRNAQRLQRLIQSLLDVAKIDSKEVKLEPERFELSEKVRQVVTEAQSALDTDADGARVRLALETAGEPLLVHADRLKTEEVLSNLLRNAVQHSPAGGTVVVSTSRADGQALVQIRDEGEGIDPEVQPRLFEKFATSSGTGLGLFICKSYVEAQGGRIWAQDNAASGGLGATFSFTLPLDTGEAAGVA
ncbi:MAG: ATP-binding protein [Nitrososphaerales archaeon]